MSAMRSIEELAIASLRSPQPEWELQGAVRAFLATGHDRETLIRELNRLRRELGARGREREEGAIFDVLDALSGWSRPAPDA